jgi:hypothetical protein
MTILSAVILRGTTVERPTAGLAGRLFYDTTLTKWQRDNGTVWQDCDLLSPQDLLHAEGHAFWGSDPIDIQDILNYGTVGQVPRSDGKRGFFMGGVAKSLLSATFAIDSTGIKTVTTAHGLIDTFAAKDVVLTVIEDTNVDDWAFNLLKVESVDTTNVVAKINVSTASGTGAATAKLGIVIHLGLS